MAILFGPESGLITIQTKNTTYQMLIDAHQYLLHLYYGKKMKGSAVSHLDFRDRGFSANPYAAGEDRTYSLEFLPQEYPFAGGGDFRTPAFRMKNEDGSSGCDLHVRSVQVKEGKYSLPGLPSSYDDTSDAKTLEIVLEDAASSLEVCLLYGVFSSMDVITRAVKVVNRGERPVQIEKFASCCLDFCFGEYETLTFYGRHAFERNVQRTRVEHGQYRVGSRRGASSHFYNPFVILMEAGCTEEAGSAIGVHFVYSGNFLAEAEKSGYDQTRLVMGLSEGDFSWKLNPKEEFYAPETILSFSSKGLSELSKQLHRFIRAHIVRGAWHRALCTR